MQTRHTALQVAFHMRMPAQNAGEMRVEPALPA